MYIEKRKIKDGFKYYLSHTFRYFGKIRKLTVYLGRNLTSSELTDAQAKAKKDLLKKEEHYIKMGDPFYTEVAFDKGSLEGLEVPFKVFHLSDSDWDIFERLFTYNTNAIEGSTLSERDVNEVIAGKKITGKKSDIDEAIGLKNAIDWIHKEKPPLSIATIKKLHKIVFGKTKPFAGEIRKVNVVIRDVDRSIVHRGFDWKDVESAVYKLCYWYNKHKDSYNPIVLAAVVHNRFEEIHPFQDGNGRIGRLLLNLVLLQHNYPPININLKNREQYYSVLKIYTMERDIRPTIKLILKEYKQMRSKLR